MLEIFKAALMFLRANPLQGLIKRSKQRQKGQRSEDGADKIDGSEGDKQSAREGQDEKTEERPRVGATWHIHVMEEPLVEEISYLQELADDLERERISGIQKKHIKEEKAGGEPDVIRVPDKTKGHSVPNFKKDSREV